MRRFILAVGLSASLLVSSMPAAPAVAAAEAAARPAKPSERALSLARRYFVAMQFEQTVTGLYDSMDIFTMLEEGDDASMAGLDREAMSAATKEAMIAFLPKMVDAMVPVVAATFTEQELEAMVAFYESDVGRSVVAKSASMTMPMMQSMMEIMPDYMGDIIDRYCAKASCSAGMKDKMRKQLS